MAPDDRVGEAEHLAELPHLVLEEIAQRLDELEAEILGKAADVVVQLDVRALPGVPVSRLDDVGVERALGEEAHFAADGRGALLEHVDEAVTDPRALELGIRDAVEVLEELPGRVDDPQVDVEVVAERRLDELALLLPEESVVDEDARELVADRPREQGRDHGGVDPAAQAADDADRPPTWAWTRRHSVSRKSLIFHVPVQRQIS